MFRSFAAYLSTTSLSSLFRAYEWIVPSSQSTHIVCVATLFTSALVINFKILGYGSQGRSLSQLSRVAIPCMWIALAGLVLTGAVQTIAEPVRQFIAPLYWIKMFMILAVALLTAWYSASVRSRAAEWDAPEARPPAARAFAVSSTVLWALIIICGRFIGYTFAFYL
jgi:hypothetical protein